MNCTVCDGATLPYFVKDFAGQFGLRAVQYRRCRECGFVFSETHLSMSDATWEALNARVHGDRAFVEADDPRARARISRQAAVIEDLASNGLVRPGRWLDYGAGDGALAAELKFQTLGKRRLFCHDPFLPQEGYLKEAAMPIAGFELVVTTSVLEHMRFREELDYPESLVSVNGALAIHTLVCEEVPCDPSWFYLSPVHCSFFTNRSMEYLFRDWGYTSCAYNVPARLWVFFSKDVLDQVPAPRLGGYHFAARFVDYWKGEPRRAA